MKNLNEKMLAVSQYLQTLSKPEFSMHVQQAVEKNDAASLAKICRKAKVPQSYVGTMVSTIMSVKPMKWPYDF
jgi:hypothetical protein